MPAQRVAPYGSWASPIRSLQAAAGSMRMGPILLDGADTYWVEGRPQESGRITLVRHAPDGTRTDQNVAPFNVRSRVHEYGGKAAVVDAGEVYCANFADQRVYRLAGGKAQPLTPESTLRYADFTMDRGRDRLLAVGEDHAGGSHEPVNMLVAVPVKGGAAETLVSGADFYAYPRLSPDGQWLAWIQWNHPNMPWDGTELWVARLDAAGRPANPSLVAGGTLESVLQPEWSPDGILHFISDRTGWWNLYRLVENQVLPLHPLERDFGYPLWSLGVTTYGFESANRIVCTYCEKGNWVLGILTADGTLEVVSTPYTSFGYLAVQAGRAVFHASSPAAPTSVVELDVARKTTRVLHTAGTPVATPAWISVPESIEFPTSGERTGHAFFYPPVNPEFTAPAGEKPPLLVMSHGGPTGQTSGVYDPKILYWTSRGIAVVDVNYGGSTGFGRAYRSRLDGQWGVVDVEDCSNVALHLVKEGRVDANRLTITGGSAGGFTTLCALTFHKTFKAGASHYGICDLEALARDTHKFESRYLDRLIGPYPARQDLYIARSPIHHVEQLSCPIILFQGLEDKVVLPNQAEMMRESLRKKGLPVAYLPFAGEQHGFRKAENIARALEAEFYFYSQMFGFKPADIIEPVVIENQLPL